jgi:7-carboxy-7-deazaguanine synthase
LKSAVLDAGSGVGHRSADREPARLKITEIFFSIQGEANATGWPSVFVRLTGCPLRCAYCDTAYAFGGGQWMTLDEILASVAAYGAKHVCVTGGEPLAQSRCQALLTALCDAGFDVSLETSGAIDVSAVDPRVCRVVDIKTPGSGEQNRNMLENLAVLGADDVIKFVICGRSDYEWSRDFVRAHPELVSTIFFSPSFTELPAGQLADWIIEDRLPVRLQVQLHKVLWGDVAGR